MLFLVLVVLFLCVGFVIVAYAYQGRTSYTENCFDVLQHNPDVCAAPSEASTDWYKQAFIASTESEGLRYPTVASTESSSCEICEVHDDAPFGCCDVYQYDAILKKESAYKPASAHCVPAWNGTEAPTWEDAESSKCHRFDKDGLLQRNADLDGVCYACICTVVAKLKELSDSVSAGSGQTLYATVGETSRLAGIVAAKTGSLGADHLQSSLSELLTAYGSSLAGLTITNASLAADVDIAGGYCEDWNAEASESSLYGYLAMFAVSVFNLILKYTLMYLIRTHEKNDTTGVEQVRVGYAIYGTQLLNTALLTLLLRSAWVKFVPGQKYAHVNAKWYAEIAAPLLWTVGLNYVSAPLIYFSFMLLPPLMRCVGGKPLTQNRMNAAFAPSEFSMASGYAEMLVGVTVTLVKDPRSSVCYMCYVCVSFLLCCVYMCIYVLCCVYVCAVCAVCAVCVCVCVCVCCAMYLCFVCVSLCVCESLCVCSVCVRVLFAVCMCLSPGLVCLGVSCAVCVCVPCAVSVCVSVRVFVLCACVCLSLSL